MKNLLLRLAPAVFLLAAPLAAQAQSDSELFLRLNRAEQQVRELTGQVEQLQYRNQQLEQQLRSMGGAPQAQAVPQAQPQVAQQPQYQPPMQQQAAQPQYQQQGQQQPQYQQPQAQPPQVARADSGRRSDVFDPSQNPNAPGVPRALGGSAPVIDEPDVGAPGGRAPGQPLDLSTMGVAAPQQQMQPGMQGGMQPQYQQPQAAPMQRPSSPANAVVATLPPSQTPKDEFDLGYGYVLRKDYALAEDTLRGFLQKYPSDALAADAQYWLGESMFQRQRYRDAAENFLKVTTSYGNAPSKGAESLLRLGQSLAQLNEREAACAALGEISRKYPKASSAVKQGVDREQKRVRC